MTSRTLVEISVLAMRTENEVRWLHSHNVWCWSLVLTMHPVSDQSLSVVFQKTQKGLLLCSLFLGKSSLIPSDESLLPSSVADITRPVGTVWPKLFLNLSIRFFTATVFKIPLVLFRFTSMPKTDILQSLPWQNFSSKFWLLNPLLLLTWMFFTRSSTDWR